MGFAQREEQISEAEVADISRHEFWVLIENREFFVSFEHFPWFLGASIKQILDAELQGPGHLQLAAPRC